MEYTKPVLYVLLALFGVVFIAAWIGAARRARGDAARAGELRPPTPYSLLVGVITDFFDTWGIGSFATTTALFRARRTIDGRLLPGTLNVGHTLPTILQAYLFFDRVDVEPTTLVSMIAAAVCGAWLGAGVVAHWSRPRVQRVMGAALLAIGAVMAYRLRGDPAGGGAMGLSGAMLVVGVVANFVLGVLMTMGIGLYAPCLLLVCVLGMNPTTGFPIMMGSCAFLMPLASLRFFRERGCDLRAALGLTIGGIPAVLAAVYLFKQTNLRLLTWIVLAVVLYTAISLLLAARRSVAGDGAGSSK